MDDSMNNMFEPDDDRIKLIVELAKETSVEDPISWDGLNISEEQAYVLMATHVMEMDIDDLTARSIIVKLLVENFVLNLKLLGKK
jgi:hypothetical protein